MKKEIRYFSRKTDYIFNIDKVDNEVKLVDDNLEGLYYVLNLDDGTRYMLYLTEYSRPNPLRPTKKNTNKKVAIRKALSILHQNREKIKEHIKLSKLVEITDNDLTFDEQDLFITI